MTQCEKSQTVADFRANFNETLDRVQRTGEAEEVTENGEVKAILVSAAEYSRIRRELEIKHDLEAIDRSVEDVKAGRVYSVAEASVVIRKRLEEDMKVRKNAI